MHEIARYLAKDDEGEVYTIIAYQEMIDAGHFGDPQAKIPGLKQLLTSDGDHVNYIDDSTFKIVVLDKIVRKIGEA